MHLTGHPLVASQVLRYRVYSVEVVVDNPTEPVRNRVYDLSYFTTDCTMSVFERSQENSGLQQVRCQST